MVVFTKVVVVSDGVVTFLIVVVVSNKVVDVFDRVMVISV